MGDPFFSNTVRTRADGSDERIQSKIVGSANTTLSDTATHQAKVDASGLHVVVDNVISSTPTIYNVSVPLATTEVSQALSANCKKFMVRVRGNSKMQLAYTSGDSGLNFITIPQGCAYLEEDLNFTGTLYFQTEKASQVVEILEWV